MYYNPCSDTELNEEDTVFTKRKNELVFQRTVRAVKKHFITVAILVLLAAIPGILWYLAIWRTTAHVEREDADLYLVGIYAFVSVTWIMLATEMVRSVLRQNADMVKAAKYADKDTIIDLKDDHIPLLIPFVLILLAIIIGGLTMAMPFKTGLDGAVAVFIITLVFLLYGRLIYELEDPTEAGWVRAMVMRHDPKLLDTDAEEVFARRWIVRRTAENRARPAKAKPVRRNALFG